MTKDDKTRKRQVIDAPRVGGFFSFDPGQLTLIVDTADPLYDPHVHDEIPDGAVLDVAAQGVQQNIGVRERDGQKVVIFGRQRTKRALVANALIGTPYRGPVKAVHDAIKRMSTVPESIEIAKRVVAMLGGAAVMLPGVVRNKADDGYTRGLNISENLWRRAADPVVERAAEAQRLQALGWSADSIREKLAGPDGLSIATVNRWLKIDLSKPRTKAKRSKATRPAAVVVKQFYEKVEETATKRERLLMAWILGAGSKAAVEEAFKL